MFMKRNQSGRSMIEMLGVLAIMGVITVMAIKGISGGSKSVKLNSYRTEIIALSNEIRDLYGEDVDYSDISQTALTNMGHTGTGVFDSFTDATVAIQQTAGLNTFNVNVTFADAEECRLVGTVSGIGISAISCVGQVVSYEFN